jgi:hypothetical protein
MYNSLESYLTNYAEPETRVPGFPQQYRYHYSLVVPAFSESIHCIDLLMSNIRNHALLILVANAPPGETESTQHFTRELLQKFPCQWSNQHLYLLDYAHQKSILLVDRCSQGRTIPKHQGVGLARKIGFDVASKLILQGNVESPWINTTDADVTLPRGYPNHDSSPVIDTAARLYPFRHISSPGLRQAIGLYDFALQYYLEGLRYAGSPYAYHAIGSTMCIHCHSYAQVRGFPRRAAAEDFYMLNKLAKVGRIESFDSPVLDIQARLSDRVPFGTGHALGSILKLDDPLKEYLYYNPCVFLLLRNWLEVIPDIWPNRHQADIAFLTRKAGKNQQILRDWMVESGMDQIVHKGLNQYRSPETFERYLRQWFDAFKTLKFIHLMRDRYFASLPLETITSLPLFASIGIQLGGILDNAELNLPGYQRGDHD